MENKRVLVIIPTFDELENLTKLLPRILEKNNNIHVLIVDDNSPDGTAKWVREQAESDERIKLIEREKKMGLGTAYITGFKYALQNGYDYIFEMDADFSHDPKEIKNFLREMKNYDLVLGSRYKIGVNVINWPLRRLMLSLFANAYTRLITGMPIHDATSGFKCFRKEILQAINLDEVKSNGYAFQIEMTFKAWKKGFKIKEISIVFTDRVKGKSKMSKKIVREAIFMVWKLRWASMFGILK
jgi:dolichol-phosphate mannosyltransferase